MHRFDQHRNNDLVSVNETTKETDIMINTFPYLVLPYLSDNLFQNFLCLPAKVPGYTIVL